MVALDTVKFIARCQITRKEQNDRSQSRPVGAKDNRPGSADEESADSTPWAKITVLPPINVVVAFFILFIVLRLDFLRLQYSEQPPVAAQSDDIFLQFAIPYARKPCRKPPSLL